MIYNSYWNNTGSRYKGSFDTTNWDFKDYKDYVYFKAPENIVKVNGASDTVVYGRIRKVDGEKQIFFVQEDDDIFMKLPLGNFTVFDDTLYTWFWDGEHEEFVVGDWKDGKAKIVGKLKNVDGVSLVMRSSEGCYVCLILRNHGFYVRNMNDGCTLKLPGFKDMEASLKGYNEKYIYYATYDKSYEDVTYYSFDIDTFEIDNISENIRDVSENRELYMIDCRTDTIYLKDTGKKNKLIAVDRLGHFVKEVPEPILTSSEENDGRWEFEFNGKNWFGLHEIQDNFNRGVATVVYFGEDGSVSGSDTHVVYDYAPVPEVVFSFSDAICVWQQHQDEKRQFYENAKLFRVGHDVFEPLGEVPGNVFVYKH
jgi:hypothetical protein